MPEQLKQYGGLSYGKVKPVYLGQPVKDIKESRQILQQRSDVARAKYTELETTYGNLVDKVNEQELGYLQGFKDRFEGEVGDMVSKGEFEYLGTKIARSAAKLQSDVGLRKRMEREKEFKTAQASIDSSDWSWEEKVKLKGWQESQYKPITQEEDVSGVYKDTAGSYRIPPSQAEVAKELSSQFKNLKPNSLLQSATHFIKAGADGTDGYDASELTTNFEESTKNGLVIDSKTGFTSVHKERIADFFKNLANENINPEIAEFLKFKYELANRKEGQSNAEFNASLEAEGYDQFVEDTFNDLAGNLAYSQTLQQASMRHMAGLDQRAKRSADDYVANVISYDEGQISEVPSGASAEQSVEILQQEHAHTDTYIKDQQTNIGISKDNQKDYNTVKTELDEGKGIKQIFPTLKDDNVKSNQMASAIMDQQTNESVSTTRMNNASDYAMQKLIDSGDISQDELADINTYKELIKSGKVTETYEGALQGMFDANVVTKLLDAEAWAPVVQKTVEFLGRDTVSKYNRYLNDYYEETAMTELDSQVMTKFPKLSDVDKKVLNKDLISQMSRANFFKVAKPIVRGGAFEDAEEFIDARAAGSLEDVELVGYRPAPINGQRHWVFNVKIKGKDGKMFEETEVLIPMNALRTEGTDALLSLPQVKAADMLNQPMINNLTEWEPYDGVVIRYNKGAGNSLTINDKLYTDPNQMTQVLSDIILNKKDEMINGVKTE